MAGDESVTYWLRQLDARDASAASLLWQRYYHELVELARARLGKTPRRVIDEEDIAVSVFRCMYEGAAAGMFAAVVNRQELWQLLATVTIRKVIDQKRLLTSKKRGGGRVRGDSVLRENGAGQDNAGFDQVLSQAVTPEVLAIAAEEYERLMRLLDDDRLREIAQCKLEGYRNEEIGQRLGLACRSIERKLQRIRQIWRDELTPAARR
jgi:DNA-directed RNA polymerase specialized sigma24 family protein